MRYEIDKDNGVRVYEDGADVPFRYQPFWPDTTPWANKAEAEAYALLLIESIENPESQYVPGVSPEKPKRPRPEPTDPEA